MIRKLILCLVGIAIFSPVLCHRVAAQEVKLYPVDQAASDHSFKLFRDRLIAALKRRDTKYLLSILHPRIHNSWGGDGGVKEFVEHWKLNSRQSRVWTELLTILSLGGSFTRETGQKSFYAPYVSSRWETIEKKLPSNLDDFCCGAIVGKEVGMHRGPDSATPVLTMLSYDVVQFDYEGSIKTNDEDEVLWAKIKTFSGQDGYVSGKLFRTPTDYRASFIKVRGKWRMDWLIAGD